MIMFLSEKGEHVDWFISFPSIFFPAKDQKGQILSPSMQY